MTRPSSQLILLSFLLALVGCSTTQVQESWHRPGYQASAPQKMLVVAMASRESIRKIIESAFVAGLDQQGFDAIPSHLWIEDGSNLNRDALLPLVQQNGITTVLVTSIRDIEKSTAWQPDPTTQNADSLFRGFDTYYAYSSSGQHESGSYAPLTHYLLETNLFDTGSQQLGWSVTTRTSDTGPVDKAVKEIVKKVMKRGAKDGVW